MRVRPIGDRVVLKRVISEDKTSSGIYLPKSDNGKKEGIIQEVGISKNKEAMPLQQGDHVMYSGYNNEEIEINGEKYVIVEFKDIIAKLEE